MELNTLFAWSLTVNLCVLILLLEAFLLLRALLAAPQVLWRYLLFALFLGLSAWCFIGTVKAWQALEMLIPLYAIDRFPPAVYIHIRAIMINAVSACQLQVGITAVVLVAMLLIESKLLPRHVRPPAWVIAREQERFVGN